MRLNGGEAEPLTDLKTGVSNFSWSPDGKWIAYTMSDKKSDDEEKNDKGKNDFRWVDENTKMSRLFVISVTKDAQGKREPRQITTENYNVGGDFDWSPDGRTIAFSHQRSPIANDWTTSDVSLVEVASGKVTPFAKTPAAENSPFFSPDGKSIAITVSDLPVRWAQSNTINIFPVAGGTPKILAASHDGQPNVGGWSPDGKRIYFSEARGTGTWLYTVDVAANKIAQVNETDEVITAASVNRTGTMMAFVKQSPDTPPEIFVSGADKFAPVQISRANADMPKMPIGKTEVVKWKSKDGKEIEGLLTYPINYQAGTKVPLLLNVHGGPAGVFQQTFIGGRGSYPIADVCLARLRDFASEPARVKRLRHGISPREHQRLGRNGLSGFDDRRG